ncbi:unnamed protein product [Staurois parvus]|uniref:Uncharacterized protein n=1 Tax=Staurois parvus TaxID=386267 RepID=A0ABN9EXY8_9NEOB|nr:unnamed protein product [Staurois parvus]
MTTVYNGWFPFMPSIVYICVVSCDWSQWSHGTRLL